MLWKVYFVALILLNSPNYLLQNYGRQWEIYDALFFIVSCVGLFGFIWKKCILGLRFWQIFVPIFITWNVFYHYIIPNSPHHIYLAGKLDVSQNSIATLFLLTLLPALNALWVYAYESLGLWHPYVYVNSTHKVAQPTEEEETQPIPYPEVRKTD